jgi:phosphatidylcholine synthase
MRHLVPGVAAHLFTASGIVLAWFALEAAYEQRWEAMFLWLGAALIVDAVDGPIARMVRVGETLPRFSGERLDMIIDYVTYVLIPAVAIARSGMLPPVAGEVAAIAILFSSLYHFADRDSKTADHYFVGFPALWNVVALCLFAIAPRAEIAALIVAVLVVATFVPVKFVHPVRVTRHRSVTLAVILVGALASVWAVIGGFPSPVWVQVALCMCALYLVAVSLRRTFGDIERDAPHPD